VGVKVLKIAQGQQQVAADLISAAVETVMEAVEQFDSQAGSRLDLTA
jgi:DNA-directed RNA polymerase specialized sigma subunit